MKKNMPEIPYRLETINAIHQAMHNDLFPGLDFQRLLALARKSSLHHPPAFVHAKKKVTKDFAIMIEEKLRGANVSYRQVASLSSMGQYPLVEKSMPWIHEIIRHDDIFQFLHTMTPEIRKRCRVNPFPDSPSMMYEAMLAIRRLLRREMIIYVKANKTSCLSLIQLKQVLAALTLFDTNNDDILEALKSGTSEGSDNVLYQNAMVELLFSRMPKTIRGLIHQNPDAVGKKLRAKMTRLNLSARQIINLMGYFKPQMSLKDLFITLDRITGVAGRMDMPPEVKEKLGDYIESIKKNIDRAPFLYRTIFLNKELETCQKLYKPIRVLQRETFFQETIAKTYTRLSTLVFYPTKDYLDVVKGKISNDCSSDMDFGEKQLLSPGFFNIRIFHDKDWIGNIYCLDFTPEHDSLLIDRIQIPRNHKALYHCFFDHLRDALVEMFADVKYKYILMPVTISNHDTIQNIYNEYRKGLKKETKKFDYLYNMFFESLCGRKSYYVLHKRPKEGQ